MTDREEPTPEQTHESPVWESDIEEREARRRKMVVFGGSAVVILVGFVGLYAALSWIAGGLSTETSSGPGNSVIGQGDVATAPPETVVGRPVEVADDLDWYAIESPLGFAQRLLASPAGDFYALSTIPGENARWPVPKAVYKSGDGENWDIIPLDETQSAHDMALFGNAIYLIGTSPANQDVLEPPEVVVSATSDDGATWNQLMLPTEAAPPDGAPLQWSNVQMKIGASASAVLAVVNSRFFLDFQRLVPPEFADFNYGYVATETGVDVIDHQLIENLYLNCEREMENAGGDFEGISQECEDLFNGDESAASIGSVTWEEMGLPDGGSPNFSEMFISADGTNFEKVDSPLSTTGELQGLFATDAGFVGVEWERGNQRIWFSEDGRTWDSDSGLEGFEWVSNVGSVEGRTVVVGQARNSGRVAWRNGDGSWDVVDFDAVLGAVGPNGQRWMSSAAVGPLGVVAVFQSFNEQLGRELTEVAVGTAPDTWSIIPIEEITGASGGYVDWVGVGADQVILRYQIFNEFRQRSLQVIGTVPQET